VGISQFDEIQPILTQEAILLADGTGTKTLATAGERGCRIDGITAFCSSASAHVALVSIDTGGTVLAVGEYSIAANAGNGTVALADILPSVTSAAAPYLTLQRGQILKVSLTAALTGSDAIVFTCQGGQF
jgi:hypothetical protein